MDCVKDAVHLCLYLKCDQSMHTERRKMQYNTVSVLLEGDRDVVGAAGCRQNLFVCADADFHVVELRKVGKQTDVAAVDGRCVKHVKRKEAVALAQTHSAAGGEIRCLYHFVVEG